MNILFVYTIQKSIVINKPLAGQEGLQFGISYISSFLKQHNHLTDLIVLDRHRKKANLKVLATTIQTFSPDLICFTSVHSEYDYVTQLAKFVKSRFPEIPLMGGGVHITLNPSEEMLDVFDCICIGEGEHPVLEYLGYLDNKTEAPDIKNLWLKHNGTIIKNNNRPFLKNLDDLPFPDRAIWQRWILEPQTRITILLGRGCPYNCTYCCNHKLRKVAEGKYVRLRSPKNIVDELRTLSILHPQVNEYFLEIETIGSDMIWLGELCERLNRFNSSISNRIKLSTNLRIFPNMDFDSVFQLLKSANFESVTIGLESGSERIRTQILNRVYSNDHILKATSTARKYGIKIGIFNMVGIPTETLDDFSETLTMNQTIKPDWHATSIFFPYQGTKLFEVTNTLGLMPLTLNTRSERQKSVLNLPGFSKRQIQKSFDSFHYEVYKASENRKIHKLLIYFVMKHLGHNFFAELKIKTIALLYQLRLYDIAKKYRLFDVFQK
ncbi:B12-binding domain-containing radical SAM protein [Alkaliflexus imshenetskii]|uniref:B12-binding domain-containing radical SAM protein n=1 Tax=Alkaliflexus imshenetskii TaxID=286730 RepID=UPI000478943C|nr:radical SAM protein [Alkaliflexus imshenetskii]